jgi:type IV pilus assembly protein PilX
MTRQTTHFRHPRQQGVVLVVSLILLLILTLLGVTAARMQTAEERMAQNEHNHQLAIQAAEATLRTAETGLNTGAYTDFTGGANGLYQLQAANGSQVDAINWMSPGTAALVYAGPSLASASLAQLPVYAIESMPPVAIPGGPMGTGMYGPPTEPVTVYRVTAYAVGGDTTSSATLQSVFR